MKKLNKGKYQYLGYIITNCGYYQPDKRVVWEGVNPLTGCADYHAYTKYQIKIMIDNDKEKS